MTDVLVKEVELARRLLVLKRELEICLDYSPMAAFRSVDRHNSGVITTVNLGAFMRDHGHFASETELLAIVRRLDTDGDACITYSEWTEFMRTPALPLPLPAPLPPPRVYDPLPSYYYSRYHDWRYYDDWRYTDWKYDYYPYRYYSPYYSRYAPYSRYYPETKTVSYDVERATPYSPARTVKRETYHSPAGPRTYTSYL